MKDEYKKQLVAFIDILGFKELIEEASRNPSDALLIIGKLNNSITKAMESSHELNSDLQMSEENKRYKVKIFSDCICISYDCGFDDNEITSNSIFIFLLSLIYLQAELHLNKIFIRGGVSYDFHYSNESIIFSSALVNSYEIESKDAIYPRIVIDKSLIDYLKIVEHEANFEILNEILKKDVDGLIFIDYLEIIGEMDEESDKEAFLVNHKGIIEEILSSSLKPKIREKYLWLAKYHNQKIVKIYKPEICYKYLISDNFLCISSDVFSL